MNQQLLLTLTWLAPLPPILAFALIALFTHRNRWLTTRLAVGSMILTTIMSFIVFFNVAGNMKLGDEPLRSSFPWLATGHSTLDIGVVVDPLNATFMFMVPLAATLIFIYSTSYMASDERYTRFMGYLSLFAGSMMGLVVSDNLLTFFVFWELMGFCSYSLIGFYYFKPSAYKAAVKAFMTTRVGDMLLILGIVFLYTQAGTLNFHDIMHNEHLLEHLAEGHEYLGMSAAAVIALLIFGGTVGKSAQFPLHVWLPDAMEGPTPVSAMIHAATMVSAGIFLTLRIFPLIEVTHHGSTAFTIIGLIGAITALIGAVIAVAQYDIKRVLAYSTISQLGFMVAAVGIGAYFAAAFHLLTHAFFKALLFLASGAVIHGVEHGHHHVHEHAAHDAHDTHAAPALAAAADAHDLHDSHDTHDAHDEHAFDAQDMRNMGGLWKRMPITFVTFLIGGAALSGVPFITAGFWSKDEILGDAFHEMGMGDPLATVVFFVLAFAATLTAFYTTRQVIMTFFGAPRTEAAAHASENPPAMTFPLIVLSFFALFAGFMNIPKDFPVFGPMMGETASWLKNFLGSTLLEKPESLEFNAAPVLISIAIATTGILLGYLVYGVKTLKAGQTDPVEKLPFFTALHNRLYFDELYRAVFINPLQWIADNYTRIVDRGIIDKILTLAWGAANSFAEALKWFDRKFITGMSDAIGDAFRGAARFIREWQTGQVQNYLLSALVLAVVMVVYYLLFQ